MISRPIHLGITKKSAYCHQSILENGYRDYSYEEIQRLNTIKRFAFFDVSLEEIKTYLDTKNKALTKEILNFEREQIG